MIGHWKYVKCLASYPLVLWLLSFSLAQGRVLDENLKISFSCFAFWFENIFMVIYSDNLNKVKPCLESLKDAILERHSGLMNISVFVLILKPLVHCRRKFLRGNC
jgi:hypothetical protein